MQSELARGAGVVRLSGKQAFLAQLVADEAPQGPVVLSLPMDVADQEAEVTIQPTSYTHWRVHPDPTAIDEAAELLAGSHRPVVLIGDGVANADAQAHVGRIAELLGA